MKIDLTDSGRVRSISEQRTVVARSAGRPPTNKRLKLRFSFQLTSEWWHIARRKAANDNGTRRS
jgi:hypothetical protein